MKNKIFSLNTISKKSTLVLVSLSLFLIIVFSTIYPLLFFKITKPELTNYVSSTLSESSVRFSYILSKHKPSYTLPFYKSAVSVIENYLKGEIDYDSANEQLDKYLPTSSEGYPSQGNENIISCINYSVLSTERGDIFCNGDVGVLSESFVKSGWLETLSEVMPCTYTVLNLYNGEKNLDYLCFTITFSVDGVICHSTTLTEFSDVIIQLKKLEKNGLTDYGILFGRTMIYQSLEDSAILPEAYPEELFEGEQHQVNMFENEDEFVFAARATYKQEDLRVVVRVTKDELLKPYLATFTLFKVFFVILILVLIVIAWFIFNLFLKRLTRLDRKVSRVRSGDFDLKLQDKHNDEIGNLTKTIQIMLERIKSDTQQKICHEQNEQKMQYSLMVSAIDPHFIYNTLDTISFLAAMNRAKDIITVNDALIGTLKDRLSIKNYKIFDRVETEKSVVEQYMIIQSYLCHNSIDFYFEAGYDVLPLQIPKNIIQPLVENSLKHGLLPNKDEERLHIKNGSIRVRVEHIGNMIGITVTDNGVGMDEAAINELLKNISPSEIDTEHIGIANMRLRLAYLYQNGFELKIESRPGIETKISVIIPDSYNGSSD